MNRPTILILAQAQDTTADRIAAALGRRAVTVARVDTAEFPTAVRLQARPDQSPGPDWIEAGGNRIDLASVQSVYRRHPAQFRFPAAMSGPERRFAMLESVAGWGGVLSSQPWRWLDSPAAVADAGYKPRQIRVAAECGLRVPRSVVTNAGDHVRAFAAEVAGPIVYKSLSTGLVAEGDALKIVYTSRVDLDDLDDNALGLCAHLFQEWVPKAHDVRVTAVGERLFPVAVHAGSEQARIDWRSRYDDLRYQRCEIPDDVRAGISAYLQRFRLRFAAFDFSATPDGRWWFLEANPSGQWEWIEDETGAPITEAIADELVSDDPTRDTQTNPAGDDVVVGTA
ncbi:MAG: ATP-grasp ribosomal peptide maturase [Pseudonocardia sp.]